MSGPDGDLHARIGVARADITPPIGIRNHLWGASQHETADGVHRPLTATALAVVDDDGTARVLLSLDVCEWADPQDELLVRDAVARRCALSPADLLLHSTHTHSAAAPCTRQAVKTGGEYIAGHLALIAQRCAQATQEALAGARPAVLSWGTGASALAVDRDQDLDGRQVVGWEQGAPADTTVLVGRVTGQDGSPIAVLVGYACHATVLGWGNRLLSPDYVGALREDVEVAVPGALCLFVQGASGELAPAHQYSADPADADRAGQALALAVRATLTLMDPADQRLQLAGVVESGAPLGVWEPLPTPVRRDVSSQVLTVRLARRTPPGAPVAEPLPEHVRAERAARAVAVDHAAGQDAWIDYPVWVWQLGEAVVVAHPGEAYSWLAQTLRAALAPRPVLIANLTNGAGAFYLPPESAYARPSYTVGQTPAGPGSLEQVARAVLDHLGVGPSSPHLTTPQFTTSQFTTPQQGVES
ncbi:MAG: neutral/alkaline non-lysosomal ceramidase N-terminal domain-containing protein [Actinobacteria bacterium]|nr:neutral/alkaline non-lysosomal ceramidase N-terminal domain-containing protein [Actinomycetota bacterium]